MKLFVILFFSSILDCILSMAVLKKKSIRYSSVRSFRMNLNALIYSSLFSRGMISIGWSFFDKIIG